MNFKKRVNGSWTDTPHYIHKADTDILTTLPAVLYPNDTTATVGLKGQMEQSSTPSPTSPVMPEGCGNKTANLSNVSDYTNDNTDTRTYFALRILMSKNGSQTETFSSSMQGTGEKSFTFTLTTEADTMRIVHNGSQRNLFIEELTGEFSGTYTYSFDLESNDPATIGGLVLNDIMLNTGSQPLPYEPWGIKIPISSANTTTPVYLGEVETTRRIKKRVFTGQEMWSVNAGTGVFYTFAISDFFATNGITCVCSHYSAQNNASGVAEVQNKHVCFRTSTYNQFYLKDTDFDSTDALKSYLAQQYANGTPVVVWYVLATPETGIVNEPLMKIGNYADEIINISIPTIVGTNTFDVDTTVQPSEVTLHYHGWHPINNVHEHDNGEWN